MLMGDYKENTSIDNSIKDFPHALLFEAWLVGKNNAESVKKKHENLLLRTLSAIEVYLGIDKTVIQCSQEGVDIMEDLV
tara:strand:- start:605 stop:841 length:237 start_codon:yes stop_codon:yes gene_type:complete